MEKIYKLKSGKIFKYDQENPIFYSLNEEGRWVYDPTMLEYYIEGDYIELSKEDITDKLDKDLSKIPMQYKTLKSGTKIKYNVNEKLYYYLNENNAWIYYPPLSCVVDEKKDSTKSR